MEATWTITQLTAMVNELLGTAFGDRVWVEGEIANMSRHSSGHVYFSLIDPDDAGKAPASLGITLFKWQRAEINRQLVAAGGGVRPDNGVRVRVCGTLNVYAAQSKLQLKMTGIDPLFTLGTIAQSREAALRTLAAEGALEAQKRLSVPFLPQRIGLVTSTGSAAHADVMSEFEASPVGLQLVVCNARVQGADAASEIAGALAALDAVGVDLICLVRGGGAQTDLMAFDDLAVARAIASSTTPVWSGIGHEIDRSIADEVAHTALKTPTACAAAVVGAATRGRDLLEDRADAICGHALTAAERAGHHLQNRTMAVAASAKAPILRHNHRLDAAVETLVRSAPRPVERSAERLDSAATSVRAHDPVRVLARGFSLTRHHGRVVRSAGEVSDGDSLVTSFADGAVHSITHQPPPPDLPQDPP